MHRETQRTNNKTVTRSAGKSQLGQRHRARRLSGPASGGGPGATLQPSSNLVEDLATEEMPRLLAIARRYSVCADDAHDACQRAMEILLRRAPTLDQSTAASWLRTVVKHEAMAVRAERVKGVARTEPDLDAIAGTARAEDVVDRMERLSVASEALSEIKPREAQALLLQAEGHSYHEIAAANGWTYTKVNRLITEGSRAFRNRVAAIEGGAQCADLIEKFSDQGAAGDTPQVSRAMRLHLARCVACRREIRADGFRRHYALGIGLALALHERVVRTLHASAAWISERTVSAGTRAQAAIEAASASKLTAVAVSAAALASGGAAVDQVRDPAEPTHAAPSHAVVAHQTSNPDTGRALQAADESAENAAPVEPQPEVIRPAEPVAAEFDPMSGSAPVKASGAPVDSPPSYHSASTSTRKSTPTPQGKAIQPEFGP